MADNINYARDLIGVDHIGLGADYDGVDVLPRGVEDVSTYPYLLARLMENGKWSIEDIKKIAGELIPPRNSSYQNLQFLANFT